MLKLNASYSKKIPVAGQEYSSQSYHASVEVEMPDGLTPEDLQTRIHDTFQLVRDSVENELRNGASGDVPATTAPPSAAPRAAPGPKATPKQIKFLIDIAVRRGRDVQDLNAKAAELFGIADIEGLSKKQASDLIDRLNGKTDSQAGRRAA